MTEGHAQSVMCSYNAVNGIPTCASPDLLQKQLRQDWTFPGMVVSDCGAVEGVSRNHKFARYGVLTVSFCVVIVGGGRGGRVSNLKG